MKPKHPWRILALFAAPKALAVKGAQPVARAVQSLPALVFALVVCAVACGHGAVRGPTALETLRNEGPTATDRATVGKWLLAETISPGGNAAHATKARQRLESIGQSDMLGDLALGIDDALHGGLRTASDHFLNAARAARDSSDPRAALIAWFAVEQAVRLEPNTTDLWSRWQTFVEQAIADPRAMGWRARGALVDWALDEAWAKGTRNMEDRAAEAYGCARRARLAGPFGRGAAADAYEHFPAELPGPWPVRWQSEDASRTPRVLETKNDGCAISTEENVDKGIYYVETYFDLGEKREVLLAVQGALAVWVDDTLVVDRDIRQWGVWPRFGAQMTLTAGRHRLLARLGEPKTSIRMMQPDGRPLSLVTSDDPKPPYSVVPPQVSRDPNELTRFVQKGKIIDIDDDLTRFVASYLLHIEGSDDVASVILEPLLKDTNRATGPDLAGAALFAESDPIFESTQAEDLVRELHERAIEKDPGLWAAQLSLVLGDAQRKGAAEAVPRLEQLAKRFPRVSMVSLALARMYGELGWVAEHAHLVKELAQRFPEDLAVLHAAVDTYDAEGDVKTADALVERIRKLDPDTEIVLTRALSREDYAAALAELEQLGKRRPDRKDLAERIYDVTVRAGNTSETWKKLEAAIKKEPTSGKARLELADARFSTGDHDALRRALAEAVENGAETAVLANAITLVEGMSALEPYRLDAKSIIAAYEKSGEHMPGTAARVLDYAALWVHADGSSHMLEHELIRIQSAEAIEQFAEYRRLEGLVLQMRVIKQDGTTLEPEDVSGKPTVTFPHLEIGDYIETEQVVFNEGNGGDRYLGPRWFFREEKVAYARSEFVVITPASRPLVIETTGNVPAPKVVRDGALVTYRFRVDYSPAAPVEPQSAPITEFLPSVRIGWGVSLKTHLEQLSDAVADVVPVDPRIVRIAEKIVDPLPRDKDLERVKRLYHWVLDNIEDGDENDGRRVIVSKHGNRWRGFIMLCRAVGIDAKYAIAKSRIATPPVGPISQAATFAQPIVLVGTRKGTTYLTLGNKYAPFGYLPSDVLGMSGYELFGDEPKPIILPKEGSDDSVAFEGTGELAADGSADIDLVQRYTGRLAMALRAGLSQLPERRMREALESNLLARTLEGARLVNYEIRGRDDLDAPLVIRMRIKVHRFAQPTGKALALSPPFSLPISQLASLPTRQTPLLIPESVHRTVDLKIKLPAGATAHPSPPVTVDDGERSVERKDEVKGKILHLKRAIHIPAGRVQPETYPAFARFAERADDVLSTSVPIGL